MIKEAMNKLLNDEDLTFIEAKEVFDEIFSGLANIVETTSFLTALEAKNPTEDEISAGIISCNDSFKNPLATFSNEQIQNIVFNNSNYFDFSVTNDIICAANGLNSVDFTSNQSNKKQILKELGFNFENKISDFETTNLIYNTLDNDEPFIKYTSEISSSTSFLSVLNIINKFINPTKARNIFLGMNNKNEVEKYARIMLKLGYQNSIVIASNNDLPFISSSKDSVVAEAWKNKIFTYVANWELMGFQKKDDEELKVENNKQAASIIQEVLNNKRKDVFYEGIVINSALALYITKKADSLMDGIDLAKKTIKNSLAAEKFNQFKKNYQ